MAEVHSMNTALEIIENMDDEPETGFWFADGLYYAEVRHPASELPIRVALHGVRTPEQACEAFSVLSRDSCGSPGLRCYDGGAAWR